MLESTMEGIGNRGIVVQELEFQSVYRWKKHSEKFHHRGLSSRSCPTITDDTVLKSQESCSLGLLHKFAGVLLQRLNIATETDSEQVV